MDWDLMIKRFLFFSCFLFAVEVRAESLQNETVVFPLISPRVSDDFGPRVHPILKKFGQHPGIDLAAPVGSTVRAIMKGQVVYADKYAGYGKVVTIRHREGYVSVYAHLDELLVNPGQKVNAGEFIGRVGSTGRSTGPHLHFEWRKDGKPRDPLEYFPFLAQPAAG